MDVTERIVQIPKNLNLRCAIAFVFLTANDAPGWLDLLKPGASIQFQVITLIKY